MAGTIRKRSWTTRKGEEEVAWVADYFDQHGKRHRKQFATKRSADAWLTRTKTEVKDGIHTPDAESVTVAEAAELWLSRRKTRLLERGSLRTYSGYVAHILPLLGRMKLSRLTTPMVEAFADTLVKNLSWQRAGKVLSALKMILNNAQRRGLSLRMSLFRCGWRRTSAVNGRWPLGSTCRRLPRCARFSKRPLGRTRSG